MMYEIVNIDGMKHLLKDRIDITQDLKTKKMTQIDRIETCLEVLIQAHGLDV